MNFKFTLQNKLLCTLVCSATFILAIAVWNFMDVISVQCCWLRAIGRKHDANYRPWSVTQNPEQSQKLKLYFSKT